MTVPSGSNVESGSFLQDELVRFREEWRKEVQEKKAQSTTSPKEVPHSTLGERHAEHSPTSPKKHLHLRRASKTITSSGGYVEAAQPPLAGLLSASSESVAGHPERSHSRHIIPGYTGTINAETSLGKALNLYRDAVTAESSGDMDRAIQLYRQSFRLDANVDKAYQRMLAMQAPLHHRHQANDPSVSPTIGPSKVPHANSKQSAGPFSTLTRLIDALPEPWPSQLEFLPEDERSPVHISILPDELLVLILCHLAWIKDTTTIKRFARISRKAWVLSLDQSIWRHLVNSTYQPPQISEDVDLRELLLKEYGGDCRNMYISHPRVRLDGVYIAVCHYIRPGHSENSWVNISHLITYHRYLRFLSNGTVLSLLTNDEVPPSQVVSQLKTSLRMKGFYVGSWYLDGTTVYLRDLVDPGGRFVKYGFEMTLNLKSRPLGRWNKLDIEEYSSINLETLEAVPLVLKHERPFWFSKVRSYATHDPDAV